MDDVSRAVRFSPFFANTGFFYLKYSQQSVLLWRSLVFSYNMVRSKVGGVCLEAQSDG